MTIRIPAVAAAAALLVMLSGCFGSGQAASPPVPTTPTSRLPASRSSHVVIVVMENKEQGDVIGSRSAPYVNRLARRYAAPRNYYGIRHPSLPNYMALIGGSTFGVSSDCTDCTQNARTLGDQLQAAHVSWRAYMEGMPKPCFTGSSHGNYAKKHDPFVYFHSITSHPATCRHVVPATRLPSDLQRGRLPAFAWISPDLCNDTHDCSVAHGDRYLSKLIPPLLKELGPHGFLVLTWDEGSSDASCCGGLADGGRLPTVIAGPDVRRSARPTTPLTHYSTLRTVEDAFRLPHLRNAAARATKPLDSVFTRRPRLR